MNWYACSLDAKVRSNTRMVHGNKLLSTSILPLDVVIFSKEVSRFFQGFLQAFDESHSVMIISGHQTAGVVFTSVPATHLIHCWCKTVVVVSTSVSVDIRAVVHLGEHSSRRRQINIVVVSTLSPTFFSKLRLTLTTIPSSFNALPGVRCILFLQGNFMFSKYLLCIVKLCRYS